MLYNTHERIMYYDKNFEIMEEFFINYDKRVATIKQQIKMLEENKIYFVVTTFFKSLKNIKTDYDGDIKVKDFSYGKMLVNYGNKFLIKLV